MASYAALVSLLTTLNNIQIHPLVSTFFDHKQIQSLHQIINFLIDFMESNNSHGQSKEKEVLESRFASTALAAEDVIESHVVDQLLAGSGSGSITCWIWINYLLDQLLAGSKKKKFCEIIDLVAQIEDMNSLKEMVLEFQGTMSFKDEQSSNSTSVAAFNPLTTTKKKYSVVGFDEKVIQIMERLTGQQPDLQIVPIVGMGGIGKTTLAKSVYDNLSIVERFDVRAWVTISQEYNVKNILCELWSCLNDKKINKSTGAGDCEMNLETEDHELGLQLYQALWGRRYLVVLDDMWSVEAWDEIKKFFPNNGDRSRVVITTRISSIATHLSSPSFEMEFLDEDQSWELFCKNVFSERDCPPELEEIGKNIVRKCKGLPLSIIIIGGLLQNSKATHEYWENFASDLNSIVMSGNDAHCLKILSLSYNHLPAYLKPCFLYMGVFKEDEEILVYKLINLLVAEGFLKPKEGQTLEEVAEGYLNDLVDRNLILVDSWKWNGRIKYCKMHDLVREVCLMLGEREKSFHGMRELRIPADIDRERRIVFNGIVPEQENWLRIFYDPPLAPLARTFLYDEGPLPFKFRLLRVLASVVNVPLEDIFQYVNLRYLAWGTNSAYSKLPSSISLLWNLHTLMIFTDHTLEEVYVPSEIWDMRQLRCVHFYFLVLPDPPPSDQVGQQAGVVLPNLHTISTVKNLSFTEEVCKRISNIKKLGVLYTECQGKCHYHLHHLDKLQSFDCFFDDVPESGEFLQGLVFPSSLRKLCLGGCDIPWEHVNTIGLSLPNLEFLKLFGAAVGDEWDCVEGAFPRLKFLKIEGAWGCVDDRGLKKWTAENFDCFPVLEILYLSFQRELERIPSVVGDIQTLRYLYVVYCSASAAISSTEILDEQLSLGNEDLRLVVSSIGGNEEVFQRIMQEVDIESFPRKNFEFGSNIECLLEDSDDEMEESVLHG